jgi:glucose/arabinose dehydrogenase
MLDQVSDQVNNQPQGKIFRKSKELFFLALCLITLFGCQKEPENLERDPITETSTPKAVDTVPLVTLELVDSSTPIITSTTEPARALATIKATQISTVEVTHAPPTATPDHPPASHVNVGTADRMASDCSPDYPCNDDVDGWESRMRVPPGFEATYFARIDGKPTAITFGPNGNLYVAVVTGDIYTVDSAGHVDEFFQGLKVPTGLAFQPGSERLYVSSRLIDDYVAGEGQVAFIEDGQLTQVLAGLPCCYIGMHGPNGITFGPDGFGYVGVGGRADHGEILIPPNDGQQDELHPFEASILRFSPDGEDVEVYAKGFRNPYDLTWDIEGRLYATDNGRDGSSDEEQAPPDELHEVIPGREHGYPYYECPDCFGIPEGLEVIPPLHELIPHGAVAGITTYLHDAFPGYYNDLFLVLWSAFPGAQKVQRVGRDRAEISDFATGFAAPIDIVVGTEGSLYVADFATGIIFQISYVGDFSDNSS